MAPLIAFLRAINVGGHNVKMADLRSLVSGYGLSGVETFIASGNVIVEGAGQAPSTIEALLEARLTADLGYPVTTFVRTTGELAETVAARPFSDAPGRYYVTFLKELPSAELVQRLAPLCSAAEELVCCERELHWLVREGYETRLTDAQWRRLAAGPGTTRNITTVGKLAAKYPHHPVPGEQPDKLISPDQPRSAR